MILLFQYNNWILFLQVMSAVFGIFAFALDQTDASLDVMRCQTVQCLFGAVFHKGWTHALQEFQCLVAVFLDEGLELGECVVFFVFVCADGNNYEHNSKGEHNEICWGKNDF